MSKQIAKLLPIALTISIALTTLSLAFPLSADAMISGCRGDPIIHLSNGVVLDVYVDISTDASSVKSIVYDVHVPAGVSLLSYVATPTAGMKDKESVVIIKDSPAGQYSASTVVYTNGKGKGATWTTTLVILSTP